MVSKRYISKIIRALCNENEHNVNNLAIAGLIEIAFYDKEDGDVKTADKIKALEKLYEFTSDVTKDETALSFLNAFSEEV